MLQEVIWTKTVFFLKIRKKLLWILGANLLSNLAAISNGNFIIKSEIEGISSFYLDGISPDILVTNLLKSGIPPLNSRGFSQTPAAISKEHGEEAL